MGVGGHLVLPYGTDISTTTKSFSSIFERGKKFFELSNHLGNVLVTISDKKFILQSADPTTSNGGCTAGSAVENLTVNLRGTATSFVGREIVDLVPGFETGANDELVVSTNDELTACTPLPDNGNGVVSVYAADVVSAQDYAPFGMQMVGRTYNSGSYRYGFNGKENDNEVKGEGNQQDYGIRIYDPRISKFLSVDSISKEYPWLTPYQFASNTPIQAVDLDGTEAFFVHGTWSNSKTWAALSKENFRSINEATGNTTDLTFDWKYNGVEGPNNDKARQRAGKELANTIIQIHKIHPGEPITIIGHSHGGNVGIIATNILAKSGIKVDYLVTINTPVREYHLSDEA